MPPASLPRVSRRPRPPAPAPTPSTYATFAGAFAGGTPNRIWRLYAVDDVDGDSTTIAQGWTLTITTTTVAEATTTSVTSTPNPSVLNGTVTFSASVLSGGSPVTEGSVTFANGRTQLQTVPVDGSGRAIFTTGGLAEGSHQIRATYNGTSAFLTSNSVTTQIVDRPTGTEEGGRFCNFGGVGIRGSGVATPYPSRVNVTGLTGQLTSVRASIERFAHAFPRDVDMMLVAPSGQSVVLMSDTGGSDAVRIAQMLFQDGGGAVGDLTSGSSGSYRPTDESDETPDSFPAPAPSTPTGSSMAGLNASAANGAWSLYVVDDAGGDAGSIGKWCVQLEATTPTSTALAVQPASTPIQSNTELTATVSAGGSPVTVGFVEFYDTFGGTRTLLGTVSVGSDGTARLVTNQLAVGNHRVRARYTGFAVGGSSLGPSASPNVIARVVPIADAGGPYTTVPGSSIDLNASRSRPFDMSYVWDVDGDGVFTDASGEFVNLPWERLQELGIEPGRTYRVRLRVTENGVSAVAQTTLTVGTPL